MRAGLLAAIVACSVAAASAGCGGSRVAAPVVPNGDAGLGRELLEAYGCGSCHTIGGVPGADGKVGPPLVDFADRRYIAGQLPNAPANLVRWIVDPQEVEPGTVMPDLDVGEQQARDIAAYLYGH